MIRRRAHSPQTLQVLRALGEQPATWRHGYDLCVELGLKSGSLYPILIRLRERGLLDSAWETPEGGRPPRHLYRLSSAGLAEASTARRSVTRASSRRTQLGPA